MTPRDPEALRVAFLVLDVLDELGCRHHLGGSYASSIHGLPRQTHDVDIVVEIEPRHVPVLAERLTGAFYLDAEAIRSAIEAGRACNLVNLAAYEKGGTLAARHPRSAAPSQRAEQHLRSSTSEQYALRGSDRGSAP